MNTKSPFNHMLCMRSDDHFYKLVFVYGDNLPEKTQELIVGKVVRKILGGIGYTMGYLRDSWKKNNVIINHIEIIIPPRGEYLLLQDRLIKEFLQEGRTLSVKVGFSVPIPDGNLRENIKVIEDKIKTLVIKDYGNN